MDSDKYTKPLIFAAGLAVGTLGLKLLSSKDAKCLYANVTAAVLRGRDCVMKTVSNVQEEASDVYAQAQKINEDRKVEEEEVVIEEETAAAEI